MRGFYQKIASVSIVLGAAFGQLCAGAPDNVLHMWNAGTPDLSKRGAGFPEIGGIVHSPVFKADEARGGYNHHAHLVYFKGMFYACWSNQRYGEDGPGQRVMYATSKDGRQWSLPKTLFMAPVPEAPWGHKGVHLAAGRWTEWNGKLIASAWLGGVDAWRNIDDTSRKDKQDKIHEFAVFKFYGDIFREIKSDGVTGPVFGFMEEKPKDMLFKITDGKKTMPGFTPFVRKDYGKDQVDRQLCEAFTYKAKDGKTVALFRDGKHSHRLYVGFSSDGEKWSVPRPTDIPDSPSATYAINLPDGTVLMVGNQMADQFDNPDKRHYGRDPLMISVSKDGYIFDRAYAARIGQQKYTIPRRVVRGRGGGAQYPEMIRVDDMIYVIYSMGKEDIWVSSFPLKSIGLESSVKK